MSLKTNILSCIPKSLLNFALYPIAVSAGAILPLAFAPLNFYPLAVVSIAILLGLWLLHHSTKQAWLIGWLYGLGYFGVGVSWVYISIHRFGNANAFWAALITVMFVMFLALFPATLGYIFSKFLPKTTLRKTLLAFPALWVIMEFLRGSLFTGFPWLFLGYSQMATPLKNLAPIFGIFGVSFATAFSAAALVAIIISKGYIKRVLVLASVAALWLGCYFLGQVNWVTAVPTVPLQVSLIQGNIPQSMKWRPEQLPMILKRYFLLTEKHTQSDIIIWPEAAIPTVAENVPSYIKKLDQLAKRRHVALITGIPYVDPNTNHYYNAIVSFGKQHNLYLKRRLVPFGEYTPLVEAIFAPLVKYLNIPMSDFSKGPNQQPEFKVLNYLVGATICYEVAFPNLFLNYLPQANFLISISDDSWFGDSWAGAQQLQMTAMRSLEVGRYQLVATNSGITAIINQRGEVLSKAPQNETFVLTDKLLIYKGETPWVCFGHYLWLICTLVLLGIAL